MTTELRVNIPFVLNNPHKEFARTCFCKQFLADHLVHKEKGSITLIRGNGFAVSLPLIALPLIALPIADTA